MSLEELLDFGDAIAIVGLGVRFPGAHDPAAFWTLLVEGREGLREVPAPAGDDGAPVGRRGTLDDVEGFDPEVFGMTGREAALLDPQHRLFLEVAWEALEAAGLGPRSAALRDAGVVGVYAGCGVNSYLLRNLDGGSLDLLSPAGYPVYVANDKDFLATRVAYTFDLRGPCLNVQTACSTALVAVHLACRALLAEECDVALAGAAAITFPHGVGYRWHEGLILSPDGRCRAFDRDAAGTVPGSGAGCVALTRLDRAIDRGDPIVAVLRGTAINNDGAARVGFTAPSSDGQAAVIREALAAAGIDARTLGMVEAHGTGTPVGDPIEVAALTRALRAAGATAVGAIPFGSVKTNVGHLDAAAGMAGLAKAALAVRHGIVPASLHFTAPNPECGFDRSPLAVNPTSRPWPPGRSPRRAGVSAFGIGGTNAHVVVEEPPAVERPPVDGPHLLTVSARTESALRALAGRWAAHLDGDPDLASCASTLAHGRAPLPLRAALSARDARDAADRLRTLAVAGDGVARGVERGLGRLALLFAGQGGKLAAAGVALSRISVARRAFEALDPILAPTVGSRISDLLASGDADHLRPTRVQQPALFALQMGLLDVLTSWGVICSAVVGHSAGEVAAAVAAGVLSRADGARLACLRGRWMEEGLPGGMAAVFAAPDEIEPALPDGVTVAVVNAPRQVVIGGAPEPLTAASAALTALGFKVHPLSNPQAFHTARMDPVLAPFLAEAAALRFAAPTCTVASGTHGRLLLPGERIDATWFRDGIRAPVRFDRALEALVASGHDRFLELGPDGTLSALARERTPSAFPLLTGDDAATSIQEALGALWTVGTPVKLPRVARSAGPTYPFERRRCFVPERPRLRGVPAAGLGVRVDTPLADAAWARVWTDEDPILAQHRYFERATLPAVALFELLALAAGDGSVALADVAFVRPVVVAPGESWELQVSRRGDALTVHARKDAGTWALIASARVDSPTWPAPLAAAPAGDAAQQLDVYALVPDGVEFGPLFRAVRAANRQGRAGLADLVPDPGEPLLSLLEGGLQTASAVAGAIERVHVPAAADSFVVDVAARPEAGRANVRTVDEPGGFQADVDWLDAGGARIASVRGLRYALAEGWSDAAVALGQVVWQPAAVASSPRALGRVRWLGDALPLDLSEESGSEAAVWVAPAGRSPVEAARGLLDALASLDGTDARLFVVTRGGAPLPTPDPVMAGVLGLARTLAWEDPQRFGGVVDLPVAPDPMDLAALADEILQLRRDVVALRDGVRHGVALSPVSEGSPRLASGTWLVLGGTGAVGGAIAGWLREHGATDVVLAGRRPPSEPSRFVAVDARDPDALAAVVRDLGPLAGAVVASGVLQDATLGRITDADLSEVADPKIAPATWLAEHLPLDVPLVLVSSIAGVVGAPGQGAYALANAALDAIAAARVARGGRALAVSFGALAGGGMAERVAPARLADLGIELMDPGRAVAALGQLLAANVAHGLVARGRWRATATRAGAPFVGRTLGVAPREERHVAPSTPLPDRVVGRIRRILGLAPDTPLDRNRPLLEYGLDSLTSIELRNQLAEIVGRPLPATLIFDHPTVSALLVALQPAAPAAPTRRSATTPSNAATGDDPGALLDAQLDALDELLGSDG